MYDEHEIPDEHQAFLRRLSRMADEQPIPEAVERQYWKLKLLFDRIGERVTERDMIFVAYFAGQAEPTADESAPTSVVDLWNRKDLAYDDPVEALYRKKWHRGVIQGVNASGEAMVRLEGDAEIREFAADRVRALQLQA